MSKQEVTIRACYTPGAAVTFSPGWPVHNDPEQNQTVEIGDVRSNRFVHLTLAEDSLLVEVYKGTPDDPYQELQTKARLMYFVDNIHLPTGASSAPKSAGNPGTADGNSSTCCSSSCTGKCTSEDDGKAKPTGDSFTVAALDNLAVKLFGTTGNPFSDMIAQLKKELNDLDQD